MNILISNDDGVFKYGLKVLANALASMEDVNVYVFGPSRERSCAGHGLFLHEEQTVTPYSAEGFDRVEGVWACSGTPADCVKTGVSILRTKGVPIDMVCTGVNHGVPRDTIISVNVPDIPADQLKGVKVCPIGPRDYTDGIRFLRKEGDSEVWEYESIAKYRDDPDPAWDVSAWQDGWVTVTPVQMMHENAKMMDLVRSWGISLEK